MMKLTANTSDQMEQIGASLTKMLMPGSIVLLEGNLGAGKTTLVRGFLSALGYEGTVKSPTYTIVEPYEVNDQQIYHFDLYRISSACELDEMGFQDYLEAEAICFIEWPSLIKGHLPHVDIYCTIEILPNGERQVYLEDDNRVPTAP